MDFVVLRQYRYCESNKHCVGFGEWGDWVNCDINKFNEIKEYISRGYSYQVRELVVK